MTGDSLNDPDLLALIRCHAGEVKSIDRTERGFSSDLTAIAECGNGRFFVKAVANRSGGRRDSLMREHAINQFAQPVSPKAVWSARDDRWIVIGFEAVNGRHADFSPDSTDLLVVTDLLNQISAIKLPPIAEEWEETRWDRFAEPPEDATLFNGDALLYTDVNPSNFLIGEEGAWVVDWSWPTRGAAFIDPAVLVLQLITAGHGPLEAESWAERCTAWRMADPGAVDAFALANLRMYQQAADRKPGAVWLADMGRAAAAWVAHRSLEH
jgi:hypothetical protein